jgi:hypothetical protein
MFGLENKTSKFRFFSTQPSKCCDYERRLVYFGYKHSITDEGVIYYWGGWVGIL